MSQMEEDSSSSAALVAHWRELRSRGTAIAIGSSFANAVGSAVASRQAIATSDTAAIRVVETAAVRHYELDAEAGSYAVTPGTAELTIGPVPTVLVQLPELMLGVSLVMSGDRTDEGVIIGAVTPVWRRFLTELANSSTAFNLLDWRQTEELVAGAYREDGWTVTLTPRSGDKGRDIVAYRNDIGAIRVLDQVKRYASGHIVDAGEVRQMFGVLNLDSKASKAVITTTSRFAPGVAAEFAAVTPTRLELRDGSQLRQWLQRFLETK